jgi:hypothetical protein
MSNTERSSLASIRELIEQAAYDIKVGFQGTYGYDKADAMVVIERLVSAVLASVPPYPEESLATRILQEQKDLEAHTLNVTDVDRLTQIRDSVLKEPQP